MKTCRAGIMPVTCLPCPTGISTGIQKVSDWSSWRQRRAGKPAVAGKAGGTGSAVVDGVTGLRVDGENVAEIATALGHLLSDPDRIS